MWSVLVSKAASKALQRAPKNVKKNWDVWLGIVEQSGPVGLRAIKGFHDEALSGTWQGWRSSRLSIEYRLIYRVQQSDLQVYVERVSKHDYR
jgi:addiction module RelE/StbE family toxin